MAASAVQTPELGRGPAARIAAFAGLLRDNGFAIGLAESRDALAVLASEAGRRPALLKAALRTLFCATRADWLRFDALFDAFWLGGGVRRAQHLRGAAERRQAQPRPLPRAFGPDAPPFGTPGGSRGYEAGRARRGERRATRPRGPAPSGPRTSATSPIARRRRRFTRWPNGSQGACARASCGANARG